LSEIEDPIELLKTCAVNKQFNAICHDKELWWRFLHRDYGYFYNLTSKDPYELYKRYTENITNVSREIIKILTSAINIQIKYINMDLLRQDIFNILRDKFREFLDGKQYENTRNVNQSGNMDFYSERSKYRREYISNLKKSICGLFTETRIRTRNELRQYLDETIFNVLRRYY
jgi:hypothetical protein